VRQLNDEPKPVYKVGLIREKGKATARALQQSLEAVIPCSGEVLGFLRALNYGLRYQLCGFLLLGIYLHGCPLR
jgi:hypothetical protein